MPDSTVSEPLKLWHSFIAYALIGRGVAMGDCTQCNGVAEMIENKGGVQTGSFTEKYRCVNCGAIGRITGKAEDPAQKWDRRGSLFNDY